MNDLIEAIGSYDLITVLGATAGGKTAFAAHLAYCLHAEMISADSRQVYRRMDIGTGKDYEDYLVNGQQIPIHLIDILEPGAKYNVYQYQKDFTNAYQDIKNKGKKAILCGGSGMYIESILKDYQLFTVPCNDELRKQLSNKTLEELIPLLESYRHLHNVTDTLDRERLIRAIEIADYYAENPDRQMNISDIKHLVLGIKFDRNSRRKRISERLNQRLENGMIDEVQGLIDSGVDAETLIYYGLEYKYITMYIQGLITYNEMFCQLETAIHQFSKRQMTWFRRMEKNGTEIHWLDGYMSMDQKMERVLEILKKKNLQLQY
jgi:tRNA dimethylallyltransferase